jgi:hypothetical protein
VAILKQTLLPSWELKQNKIVVYHWLADIQVSVQPCLEKHMSQLPFLTELIFGFINPLIIIPKTCYIACSNITEAISRSSIGKYSWSSIFWHSIL